MQLGAQWRTDWRKPVVFDECRYEGNIASRWGNISGDAMTRRFWQAAAQGCYCGHGETYLDPNDTLWWSHGGVLHGTSPAKIAFLRKLLEETIALGPGPIGFTNFTDDPMAARRANDSGHLLLLRRAPARRRNFPACPKAKPTPPNTFDTQQLTRTPLPGEYSGNATVKLPGTPWGSLWFRQKGLS